jgi:hypothetical protein
MKRVFKKLLGVAPLSASEKEAIFQLCGVWVVALVAWCVWFVCC